MTKPTIFKVETNEIDATVVMNPDSDIFEVFEVLKGMLVLMTFHPETIAKGARALADEIEDKR